MKKNFVRAMAAVMTVLSMTACGTQEDQATETTLEAVEDEIMEDEAIEDEAIEDQMERSETEEGAVDYTEPELTIENIDPYEEGLFELFGLDENVPRLSEEYGAEFVYETTEDYLWTGGVKKALYMHRALPADYMNEVMDYVYELHPDGIKLSGQYKLESPIEKDRLIAKPCVVYRLEDGTYGKVSFSAGFIEFYNLPADHRTDRMSVTQLASGEGTAGIHLKGSMGDWICLNYRYEDWPDMPLVEEVEKGDVFDIEYDYVPDLFEGYILPYQVYSFEKQ